MIINWLALDVASAPLPDAGSYVDPVSAPSHYKDPEKIAAYVAEKSVERLANASLDIDLARITAIGTVNSKGESSISECRGEASEAHVLSLMSFDSLADRPVLITFNGFAFDLPLIMRRARYLGVACPPINLDRYRSPHRDLCEILSDRNPARRRSLNFYIKRLGWTDLLEKPLDGAEEARVFETGRWEDLVKSVARDTEAIARLAAWMGLIDYTPRLL